MRERGEGGGKEVADDSERASERHWWRWQGNVMGTRGEEEEEEEQQQQQQGRKVRKAAAGASEK